MDASEPRTIVGFVADFPTAGGGEEPPGKELAEWLAGRLRESFHVEGPGAYEGWAWRIGTNREGFAIFTLVGLVDDMEGDPPRQWLITNDCGLPLSKRLFGGRKTKEARAAFLRDWCRTIDGAIWNDDRFRSVNWYQAATFDQPGDVPAPHP